MIKLRSALLTLLVMAQLLLAVLEIIRQMS